jgi:hypothetical protein
MSTRPSPVTIMDGAGADGLAGDELDRGLPITIAWEPVPGASVYQVRAVGPGSAAWSGSTAANSLVVPPATIPGAGNCAFSVLAQYSSGDPLLYAYRFSSTSSALGPSVYCGVK